MARAVKLPFSRHWKSQCHQNKCSNSSGMEHLAESLNTDQSFINPLNCCVHPYLSHSKKKKEFTQVKDKWVMRGQEQMKYVCLGFCMSEASTYKPVVQNSVNFARMQTTWWKLEATLLKLITGNAFYDKHNCRLNPGDIEARGLVRVKKWNWRYIYIYIYENVHSYIQSDETVCSERM